MNFVARAGNTNLRNLNIIDGLEDKIILNSGVIPAEITTKFDDLDRSSSLFMKIVQVPYDIVGIRYNSSTMSYDLPPNWAYNPGWKGIECDLTNKNFSTFIGDISMDEILKTPLVNEPSTRDNYLGARYEPKLYSSEFTDVFFNFDGEQLQIRPERIRPNANGDAYANINFALSNAISSDMMFKLDWTIGSYIKQNKYDGTMISARNMEKPIYTNGYVDYLRNGYNYDQSALKRQNLTAKINAAMGAAAALPALAVNAFSLGKSIEAKGALEMAHDEYELMTGEGGIIESVYGAAYEQLGLGGESTRG